MIHEVQGDILLSRAQLIVHGVAPNDHFEQGLALSLREKFPAMYQDFRHNYHVSHPECGEVALWAGEGVHIAHLFTQDKAPDRAGGHAGKAHITHVHKALRNLRKLIEKDGITSVAMPRLAAGVGGLDWDAVRAEIQQQLGSLGCNVFVYSTYVKGKAAEERVK
jgi:O-acetyl-ADP-ribose deacetylase (regulator of RNase III)